ncbi:TPA: hypothetical protein ACN34E_004489 [Vibrio parahaemolyticus]|nr:hypothetical protein [Vibrio parahaemolyticus]ELA7521328.1 hypothetical protein [Vibrio parahaemolyticus]ELA8132615.1 hypothetical protein [Vibrio parahaemolyticus]ELC0683477.1 hypothetical protein [Vibrio parahaemolyticus]HAV1358776.1 hypothetical protein [Vibrio parahaemolyticus]
MKTSYNTVGFFFNLGVSSKEVKFLKDKIINVGNVNLTKSQVCRLNKSLLSSNKVEKKECIKFILESHNKNNLQSKSLLGKSISPDFLFKNKLDRKLNVDGFGEITGLKSDLSRSQYELVLRNIIRPLKETQQQTPSIRTPHSAAVDMASMIKHSNIDQTQKEKALNDLKEIYLEGSLGKHVLHLFIQSLNSEVAFSNLIPSLKRIMDTIPNVIPKTLANDNLYGRNFDSNMAEFILNSGNEYLKKNTKELSVFLKYNLPHQPEPQKHTLNSIQSQMIADPQPWREKIPEAIEFIKTPSKDNFLKMLDSKHKFSGMLVSSLGVKAMLSYPSFSSIRDEATKRYVSEIQAQRVLIKNLSNDSNESNRSGLLLPYQHDGLVGVNDEIGVGVRPIDRYVQPNTYASDTTHNKNAIAKGRAIGIGMSGSSNLLEALFQSLKKKNVDFNVDTARLQAAAFLTYSGGHSINEAYNVFQSKHDTLTPLSYSELCMVSPLHEEAILYAYEKNLELSKNMNSW